MTAELVTVGLFVTGALFWVAVQFDQQFKFLMNLLGTLAAIVSGGILTFTGGTLHATYDVVQEAIGAGPIASDNHSLLIMLSSVRWLGWLLVAILAFILLMGMLYLANWLFGPAGRERWKSTGAKE